MSEDVSNSDTPAEDVSPKIVVDGVTLYLVSVDGDTYTYKRQPPEPETQPSPLKDLITSALGDQLSGAYDCDRCWSAWSVGTMTSNDFHEIEGRLDEIVEDVFKAVMSSPEIKRAIHMQEAIENMPSLQQRLGPDDIRPFIQWYLEFVMPHEKLPQLQKLPKGEEA
ncbi:MAG: hypothetical protein RIA09_15950 [Hoeflea sp.]|uniref:hypothetical protein n=1 Tax=Hoeflea sp. TaxID=1940281 RepID=UPI0032EB214D